MDDDDEVYWNNFWEAAVEAELRQPTPPPPPPPPMDSEEYRAYLESRLRLECAAVALFRAKEADAQNSTASANTSQLSSPKCAGQDSSNVQQEHAPVVMPKKSSTATYTSSTSTRGTPGWCSVGLNDAQGETETPQNAKRMRRKLLNKESARRSRRKKREEMIELENRVAQLREEKSELLKQISEMTKKANQEALENRALKTQVQQLRSQVNMLEAIVKTAAGSSSSADNDPFGMAGRLRPTHTVAVMQDPLFQHNSTNVPPAGNRITDCSNFGWTNVGRSC